MAEAVEDVVLGAMTALLLADQNLARGGMLVLEAVNDAAAAAQLDPTDAMCAALRGVAEMRRFVEPTGLNELREAILAQYMGAGAVFDGYLSEPLEPEPPRRRCSPPPPKAAAAKPSVLLPPIGPAPTRRAETALAAAPSPARRGDCDTMVLCWPSSSR
jgi:hypothetical protein